MRLQPFSFLLGLGIASLLPMIARVFRPVAVEATAAGMAMWDETRRIVAEQIEVMEDIAAEARARREVAIAETNGELAEHPAAEPTPSGPARRRGNGAARRAVSRTVA